MSQAQADEIYAAGMDFIVARHLEAARLSVRQGQA